MKPPKTSCIVVDDVDITTRSLNSFQESRSCQGLVKSSQLASELEDSRRRSSPDPTASMPSANFTYLCEMACLYMIYPFKMVLFHSYVGLPKGIHTQNSHKNDINVWEAVLWFSFHHQFQCSVPAGHPRFEVLKSAANLTKYMKCTYMYLHVLTTTYLYMT